MNALKTKLLHIERAIAERQKMINALETSNSPNYPEAVLKRESLRQEIEFLESERKRLEEEIKRLQEDYARRLPALEREYFALVSRQRDLLKKTAEKCEEFLDLISQLQENIHALDLVYPQYRNVCWALEQTPKDMHVRDIYPLLQARRWLENYLKWYKEVRP